jgi:hypothetical protein
MGIVIAMCIAVILGILFGIFMGIACENGFIGFFFAFGGAFCFPVILFLLLMIIGGVGMIFIPPTPVEEVNIIEFDALSDTMATEGCIYMGHGTIDSEFRYYYANLVETDAGLEYQINYVEDCKIIIIPENETPRIEETTVHYKQSFYEAVFGYMDHYTIIYLPQSAVSLSYSVDLE